MTESKTPYLKVVPENIRRVNQTGIQLLPDIIKLLFLYKLCPF